MSLAICCTNVVIYDRKTTSSVLFSGIFWFVSRQTALIFIVSLDLCNINLTFTPGFNFPSIKVSLNKKKQQLKNKLNLTTESWPSAGVRFKKRGRGAHQVRIYGWENILKIFPNTRDTIHPSASFAWYFCSADVLILKWHLRDFQAAFVGLPGDNGFVLLLVPGNCGLTQ